MTESKSLAAHFCVSNGLSANVESIKRRLSAMNGMYADHGAYEARRSTDNPLVYEYYDLGLPETPGDISFGTSIVYPGKIGDEYFMTKGHFHSILETGEVYYCLRGRGYLLMENPEGQWQAQPLSKGTAVYVPPRFAHRSINVGGDEPMVTFFAFRSDAGHDYSTIAANGFRKLIVDRDGEPTIVDNPRWKQPK